jgi:predicted permease
MFFGSGRADRELQDELEAHVAMLTDEYVHRGLPSHEARRQALIRVGSFASLAQQHRDVRGLPVLEATLQDLSYAARMFRRSPWFFAGTVLTLALGVGANGAVFGIVRAVLLQPLPYRDPDRVVMVWRGRSQPGRHQHFGDLALRAHADANEEIESASYQSWQDVPLTRFDLQLGDRAERVNGAAATANFFDVLGVSPARGRLFSAADGASGTPVLVLSDALWRRAFGADPSVIGRSVTLLSGGPKSPRTFTVIGVLPPGVHVTYPEETEAWTVLPWSGIRTADVYWTIGRLRDGQSIESAQARLASIPAEDLGPGEHPENRARFMLEPIRNWVVGDTRPSLLLLTGVSALLLFVACATVASAFFVRIASRQHELALRAAIGAGGTRLGRQLFTEGALLSVIGAGLGSVSAGLAGPSLRALLPASLPRADEIRLNVWILAFFAATAGTATILAALAPAWRGARVDVVSFLKRGPASGSADRSEVRWRRALVGVQSAMATALLLVAALLLVSFWRLSHMPVGFDSERVLTVEMELVAPKYAALSVAGESNTVTRRQSLPSPALVAFQEELLARVRALPGVVEAGTTSTLPFRDASMGVRLTRVGTAGTGGGFHYVFYVDPGFFPALSVPVLKGRNFTGSDTTASPPVVIISSGVAHSIFGSEDPVGQMVQLTGSDGLVAAVVGVVGEIRYQGFDTDPNPAIYFPQAQSANRRICLAVRFTPAASSLEQAVRTIVTELDPNLPIINMRTMDQVLAASIAERRFYTVATTALAGMALILTIVGLVVVISRTVVERRREIAIRSALGATTVDLIRSVTLHGMTPVLIGITAGVAVVLASAAPLQQFLFRTPARPPFLYAAVALLVFVVALAATLIPARRVQVSTPAVILRTE